MTEHYHPEGGSSSSGDASSETPLRVEFPSFSSPLVPRERAGSWAPIAGVAFLLFFLIAMLTAHRNASFIPCLQLGISGRAGAIELIPSALRPLEIYATILSALLVGVTMSIAGRRTLFAPTLLATAVAAIATFRHIEDLAILSSTGVMLILLSRSRGAFFWLTPALLPILFFLPIGSHVGLTAEWFTRELFAGSSLTLASPDFHRMKIAALLCAITIPFAISLTFRTAIMLALSLAIYLWSEQWAGVLCAAIGFSVHEILTRRLSMAGDGSSDRRKDDRVINSSLPPVRAYASAAVGVTIIASLTLVGASFFRLQHLSQTQLRFPSSGARTYLPLDYFCEAKLAGVSVISGHPLDPTGLSYLDYQQLAAGGARGLEILEKRKVSAVVVPAQTALAFTLTHERGWNSGRSEMKKHPSGASGETLLIFRKQERSDSARAID